MHFNYRFEFGPRFLKAISLGWIFSFKAGGVTDESAAVRVEVRDKGTRRSITYSQRVQAVEIDGKKTIVVKTE